jgi:hypothetical protein
MPQSPQNAAENQVSQQYNFEPMGPIPPADNIGHAPELEQRYRAMLPLFLQQLKMLMFDQSKHQESNTVASTRGNVVGVSRPDLMAPRVLAHEASHVFQNSRVEQAPENYDEYDYGGSKGLAAGRKSGKIINNFSAEQQASIVEDWYSLHEAIQRLYTKQHGHLTPEQAKYFEQQRDIYQPYISQFAGMNPSDDGTPHDASKEVPKAPVPGVPPAAISGIAYPSPQMGGQAMRVQAEPDYAKLINDHSHKMSLQHATKYTSGP